eukprot:4759448-Ditylum_brightwellii.AAC.1
MPSSAAQQQKVSLHHDKEINCCVAQQNVKDPISKGANKRVEISIQQIFIKLGPKSHCPTASPKPTRAEEVHKTPPVLQGQASSHCKKEESKRQRSLPEYNTQMQWLQYIRRKGGKRQRSLPKYTTA